ncbi:MAG: primosomal replication protein N [Burkholderiales bacterium]
MTNRLVLQARLIQKEQLRRTPAGVAVLTFSVEHRSSQPEAGRARDVSLEMECVALGDTAESLARLAAGGELELSGFVAARSRKSRMLVLHVCEFDLK